MTTQTKLNITEYDLKNLEEVNSIITYLQERKWSDYSPDELIRAQGKLSVLLSSIGRLHSDQLYEYELKEHHSKMKELDSYLECRRSTDYTDGEAKAEAKQTANESIKESIEAKYLYKSTASILNAVESIITACQVTLKAYSYEQRTSGNQQNK